MLILITGAFGYFGVALARRLATDGHRVIMVGRAPRPGVAIAIVASLPVSVDRLHYDMRQITAVNLRGFDVIIHLAGGGAPGGQSPDAAAALRDNVESAAHVASIAPKGARLLLASTIYVYGTGPRPFRETDTLAPDTLYGQMKAVAEAVWRQCGGTALRFAHIYGAGSGVDFGRDGVTERLARAATGGEPFTMHGDGLQRLDLVHIDDACEAVARALAAESLQPAVNVGGGEPVTVEDLARAFGVETVRLASPYFTQNKLRAMDISLAAAALDWRPRVSLAEGARGLIEMMRGAK